MVHMASGHRSYDQYTFSLQFKRYSSCSVGILLWRFLIQWITMIDVKLNIQCTCTLYIVRRTPYVIYVDVQLVRYLRCTLYVVYCICTLYCVTSKFMFLHCKIHLQNKTQRRAMYI